MKQKFALSHISAIRDSFQSFIAFNHIRLWLVRYKPLTGEKEKERWWNNTDEVGGILAIAEAAGGLAAGVVDAIVAVVRLQDGEAKVVVIAYVHQRVAKHIQGTDEFRSMYSRGQSAQQHCHRPQEAEDRKWTQRFPHSSHG